MYKINDKSKGICWNCQKEVTTTFCLRTVKFDDSNRYVENILVSACDICNNIVAIPAQSTEQIKQVYNENNHIR